MSAHFRFTVPPLEVGDRVVHIGKRQQGVVKAVNGDVITVDLPSGPVVVGRLGLRYKPDRKKIQQRMKIIRMSHECPALRAALGLPKFCGPKREEL